MSDSLKQRVSRVIAGGAHALIDKIEDAAPVAVMEQSVREVEAIIDEVRSELGRAVANRHLAQRQHVNLNKEHELIDASISQALDKNREDLAKTAIARQIDIEAQLPVLELSLADLGAQETELAGFVDALMSKKREMQAAIRDFEESRKNAESTVPRETSAYSPAGAKLEAAQSAFDRTYKRQTGLDSASLGASLEQTVKLKELSDMILENKINERLAALKTK